MCKQCKSSKIAFNISLSILPTVMSEIMNTNTNCEEPVAKYLQQELTINIIKEQEKKKFMNKRKKNMRLKMKWL